MPLIPSPDSNQDKSDCQSPAFAAVIAHTAHTTPQQALTAKHPTAAANLAAAATASVTVTQQLCPPPHWPQQQPHARRNHLPAAAAAHGGSSGSLFNQNHRCCFCPASQDEAVTTETDPGSSAS